MSLDRYTQKRIVMRVLIVEHNRDTLLTMAALLRSEHNDVMTGFGSEAVIT